MADKLAQLEDPRTLQVYAVIGQLLEDGVDDDRLNDLADLLAELAEESAQRGDLEQQGETWSDDAFVALLDSFASEAHPMIERLQKLMAERGWTGWTRIERATP
jgi:hypothetical protein